MRLKRLNVGVMAFLVAGTLWAQPPSSGRTAEVVAWNLAGYDSIPATRVARFTEAIALLDPEVLALVEVNPDCTASDLVVEMSATGACYKRTLLPQTAHQNIAVLHMFDVTVTNPRLIPGSHAGSFRLRKALAVDVKVGDFDFVLVTVHLKGQQGMEAEIDEGAAGHGDPGVRGIGYPGDREGRAHRRRLQHDPGRGWRITCRC